MKNETRKHFTAYLARQAEINGVASGTQLKRFNKEIVQAGFKAAQEVYAEHSAKDPQFKKILDDLRSFQRDQILWNRISELVFTQDMASLKI